MHWGFVREILLCRGIDIVRKGPKCIGRIKEVTDCHENLRLVSDFYQSNSYSFTDQMLPYKNTLEKSLC